MNQSVPAVHLNLTVRGLAQSATLAINERSSQLISQGRKISKLGLGQSPFPVPQPVVEALKVNARQKDYLPVTGLRELREAVADYYRRTRYIDALAENVLVAPGSKELMFLLQLAFYGDLIIPTPSWVSYAPQARIVGRNVQWVPTDPANDWRLSADELDRACRSDSERPRIVILNYPSNPTGASYSSDDLTSIAEVARKYKLVLLSDEIYGELQFDGGHVSVARYYPEGTIVSGGLSKWCGAGGWRLGVFLFPSSLEWLRDGMAAVASETYTSTSAPIQFAAVRAFQGGVKIEQYLWTSRRILQALGEHLWQRLQDMGVAVVKPVGAFYLFPDFSPLRSTLAARGIRDSMQLCERLLEDVGVAVLPGVVFGRPAEELTLRISYVDFDGARALAAAEEFKVQGKMLDESFLRTYCSSMLDALDRIEQWVNQP